MKNKSIASTAFVSQALRVVSGPLTIVLVARYFSSEEMSFYYSFFNVIAIQQILEMGIGFVIKQYMAHDYKTDANCNWLPESKENIKSYLNFSCLWFFIISVLVLLGIGIFGEWFFSSYNGSIEWQHPWWAVTVVTGFSTIFTPLQFLVEGCQKQLCLYRARVVSALISAMTLCGSIYFGMGLFSIAISVLFSNFALYAAMLYPMRELFFQLKEIKPRKSKRATLIDIWPMLSKISVTWVMGYFFWNSFNLIAFKTLPLELAGRFGFTLSLGRAGLSIAESLISSQTTVYAKQISSGEVYLAKRQFEKLTWLSCAILVFGYSLYFLINMLHPSLFIFNKSLGVGDTFWVFTYFVLLLPVLSQANFCRCFKQEPYFYLSLFVSIQVPVVFFLTCYINSIPDFRFLIPFSVVLLVWSGFIYRRICAGYK